MILVEYRGGILVEMSPLSALPGRPPLRRRVPPRQMSGGSVNVAMDRGASAGSIVIDETLAMAPG